jgi:hypothetical protein
VCAGCTRTHPDLQTLSVVFHPSRETTDTVRVQIICLRAVHGHSLTLYADKVRRCGRALSLVQRVKDGLYFPWSVIFLVLVGSLSICNGLVIKPPWWPRQEVGRGFWSTKNACESDRSCRNLTPVCEILYGFIFRRTSVRLGYCRVLATQWKTGARYLLLLRPPPLPGRLILLLLHLAEHYRGLSVTKTVLYSYALINLVP